MWTCRSSLKWRNVLQQPGSSLCVDRREPPCAKVIMDGRVEEMDRSLYDLVLAMALRHCGDERGRSYAERFREDEERVTFRLVPRHILAQTPAPPPNNA